MKKTAKHRSSGSSASRAESSLLLVSLLIVAIVAFVVWAFISISPGKTPFALTPPLATPTPALDTSVFCLITPGIAKPGEKLTITRINGSVISGEVNMQNAMTLKVTKLGVLSGNSFSTPVPNVEPGKYYVRVGILGAPCKASGNVDLTILPQIQVGTNRCDFNKDTVVNSGDQLLLAQNLGKVVPGTISGMMDLNYDGYINSGDQAILANYISTKNPKYCTTLQ